MLDPLDDSFLTPRSSDTQVRPQHKRETYRAAGNASRRTSPWKEGDRLGSFELGKLLGQGSSGFVFEAFDLNRQWRCALKILVPETVEDLVRNKVGFRRMLSIRHPNLAKVDQVHRLSENFALSMQLIEGQTFAKFIHELRRLDPREACERVLELLRQFAAALSVMHTNYLIHRDIKPQNMMVDLTGCGRIIDYGLVGTFDPEMDPRGIRPYLAGTPQYMAPEVWFDQCYLPAGDVYSLGKVIFETLILISGNRRLSAPAKGEFDTPARMYETINAFDSCVPDILRDACVEMLETSPADRPTALEISRLGQTKSSMVAMPRASVLYGRDEEVKRILDWLDGILKGKHGRLHLSGPSGIGKSRILEEIVHELASCRWVHVFTACCQVREDQPMQAFDQISDALATRFAKEELGVLEIDPGSAAILHQSFPVLRSVVTASQTLPRPGAIPARLDALAAAVQVTKKILETGPMILIIDDAQWADTDSLNVLDRLQTERISSLGIITVSRTGDVLQRVAADEHLRLGPLSVEESTQMLSAAARRWNVDASPLMLATLTEAAEGNPFRLDELAGEFRPGGVFAGGDSNVLSLPTAQLVGGLWRTRVARLSPNARHLLTLIATAGGAVTRSEVLAMQEHHFLAPDTLDELRFQRLVQPETVGDQCVRIVHDRVASGVVQSLASDEKTEAHRLWAEVLLNSPDSPVAAARIAGHLFEAGDNARAIEFADLAAKDAEQRFAKTEAARWHERVLPFVDGEALLERTRQTAVCFDEADRPVEAANYYQQLAAQLSGDDRIECELRVLTLLTRCGRTDQVRYQLEGLAERMGLPKPKSPLWSKISLLTKSCLYAMRKLLISGNGAPTMADAPDDPRIRLCLLLSRPLSLLDNLYGAELALAGAMLSIDRGSTKQQVQVAVGVAVYGSYNAGSRRQKSELMLTDLLLQAEQLDDPKTLGDCLSGIAAAHMLSGRWRDTIEPAQKAIHAYRQCKDLQTFEIAHTRINLTHAFWYLGRVRDLVQLCTRMYDESITRNDLMERIIASGGLASSAWLAAHRLADIDTIRVDTAKELKCEGEQFAHFMESTSLQLRLMYEGRYEEAELESQRGHRMVGCSPIHRVQTCRICRISIASLIAINLLGRNTNSKRVRRCRQLIAALRRENLPFAEATADLHEGYLNYILAQPSRAMHFFSAADRGAKLQGLVPISLAAQDAAEWLTGAVSSNRLEQHLRSERVVHPSMFARLYSFQPA